MCGVRQSWSWGRAGRGTSILNDMDTYSASAAARLLGTSAPRVLRAAAQLGIGLPGQGRKLRLSQAEFAQVAARLGQAQEVAGLTRSQARVLAALARAPRGLASVRAVARRAGVSPTTAGRSIAALTALGLVRADREVIAAGSAREVTVYRAEVTSSRWPELARQLAGVASPQPVVPRGSRARVVPGYLRHLFWNTSPEQLSLATSSGYIARRILTTGDPDGIAWGVANLPAEAWEHAARTRGISPQDRALARNVAGRLHGAA